MLHRESTHRKLFCERVLNTIFKKITFQVILAFKKKKFSNNRNLKSNSKLKY